MRTIGISVGAEAPAELAHIAAAFARRLAAAGIQVSMAGSRDSLIVQPLDRQQPVDLDDRVHISDGEGEDLGQISLDMRTSTLHLHRAQDEASYLCAFDPSTFPMEDRAGSSIPRVLFRGGSGRRLRMSLKVVAELRSRSWPFLAICHGEPDAESLSIAEPDEVHPRLSAAEWAAVLLSSAAILETSDQFETPSLEGIAGRDLGLPTIAHEASPIIREGEGFLVTSRWAPDAFADLLMSGALVVREPSDVHVADLCRGLSRSLGLNDG
ncbi:MAG TPA: hypothetical protein VM534_02290 [Thermoanaerobaculia bacterium]|nr:hypothetical protein [Thermoanaerobaculia bacterium]